MTRRDEKVARTEALHRGGRVEAAGEDHLHCVALADLPDEALRAAEAGEHADLNFGLREHRRLAREQDVERHRELHAAARLHVQTGQFKQRVQCHVLQKRSFLNYSPQAIPRRTETKYAE